MGDDGFADSKWQVRRTSAGCFLMERVSGWESADYFKDVARFESPHEASHVLDALRRAENPEGEI